MASSKILFFDLSSREPRRAWSANTFKTRLLLNIKGLDYETEWLEYPDIKDRLSPHVSERPLYTVPTIRMPDGKYIMDSHEIALAIEKKYPTPSVYLDSPLQKKHSELLNKAFWELVPNYVLAMPERVLNEESIPYWHETRAKYVNMSLEQYVDERGGEKAYKAAEPYLHKISAMLREKGGPFFMGKQVSYTDVIHAGLLLMFRRLGDDIFSQVLECTGDPEAHMDFLEAMKPYTERDDY